MIYLFRFNSKVGIFVKEHILAITVTAVIASALTVLAITVIGSYMAAGCFIDLAAKRGFGKELSILPLIFKSKEMAPIEGVDVSRRPKPGAVLWQTRSFDGLNLTATRFFPLTESHRWVVLVHGYGLEQSYTWEIAEQYLQHGYHVLTPDMRASGGSEGQYMTMGVRESRDVGDWIKAIRLEDPGAKIVLHGISMGAATVMLTAAHYADGVSAVIEDSGYSSLHDLLKSEIKDLSGVVQRSILTMVDFFCQQRAGFSLKEASPIFAVADIRLPILFIHSDSDKIISYAMMQRLYQACPSPDKEQYTAQNERHGSAYQDKGYFTAVFSFSDRHTAP